MTRMNPLFAGKTRLNLSEEPVHGELVTFQGEPFYRIANFDRLRPFFLTLVSSSDLWMFLSSHGGLTAGRGNPDQALFPYYTDDKIHDAAETTGSKTILQVTRGAKAFVWQPFSSGYVGLYRVQRNLYKNAWGNQLIFEERNQDLGLIFRYGWFNSARFGFVRKAWLLRTGGPGGMRVRLLDGLQNILPCGVGSQFQLEKSTLLDAYKRNELLPETGLALFRLSSIPVDRPEPAESLRANWCWSLGLEDCKRLVSSTQVEQFARGQAMRQEEDVRGERGAYLLSAERALRPKETLTWMIVADVLKGSSEVLALTLSLRRPSRLRAEVEQDIQRGTTELKALIASADGLQQTANPLVDLRHSSNVLFNVMRGGIFADGYHLNPSDLLSFITHSNRRVAERHRNFLKRISPGIDYRELLERVSKTGDAQLERLCREYLPLTFSRRHGDPSRPWNRFAIVTRRADGTRVLNYEGNWRDIFQNWEALALSFPNYLPGIISRFASASTADGYNPYRLTRDGIDWEVTDPANPWSYIGYWGDHQLIYLLKLLELLQQHDPGLLQDLLRRDLFAYANVPYRINSYPELLENPKETVVFDQAADTLTQQRVLELGTDGKLVWDASGQVLLVNLTEKMLVSLLAKLSNFIPGAGIWLNTQRPEWNDANNALVGNGVSMVTLYYLRRYLAFCVKIFGNLDQAKIKLSAEVVRWFRNVFDVLEVNKTMLNKRLGDKERKRVLDGLGTAGSRYRGNLYQRGFTGRTQFIRGRELKAFFGAALRWADHAIAANRRSDGLYHSYNLVRFDRAKELPVRRLYEMLEGQVAVLSSGSLSASESIEVLAALRKSSMYRPDQHSYVLYPNRDLPRFIERNNIPASAIRHSGLLRSLLAKGDRSLVERDVNGRVHFNGALSNARDVGLVLRTLSLGKDARLVKQDEGFVLDLFERLFDHESFTGRSGTFFGYEGLGSIYWHMVSKLLLAVQETYFRALEAGESLATLRRLKAVYYDVRAGIGDQKSPQQYGAFPMDPYSHTPAHAGARQPGLTGQVKEDILCRFGELGIRVSDRQIRFQPSLLRESEFLKEAAVFHYLDVFNRSRQLALAPGSLAFTYCQVPVVYEVGHGPGVRVYGSRLNQKPGLNSATDLRLNPDTSQSIFRRDGTVVGVNVTISSADLMRPEPRKLSLS